MKDSGTVMDNIGGYYNINEVIEHNSVAVLLADIYIVLMEVR
jgi:hypothetical protein